MQIDKSVIQMYAKTRTLTFVRELQKKTADLEGKCKLVNAGNGKMYQLPIHGKTEMEFRTQRKQKVEGTELGYAYRNMRPLLMSKWLDYSTDDPLFLANLPINVTNGAIELAHAAARMKDQIFMGTWRDMVEGSATFGEYVVRKHNTVKSDATDGSPYKGGTTSGIFGDVYAGEMGDERIALVQQPVLMGAATPIASHTDYTAGGVLNLRLTNVVPYNYVKSGTPTGSGLNVDKMAAAIQAFAARDAKGQKYIAITPQQALDIMTDEKFQNKLYGHCVIVDGLPDSIMGAKVVITDTVPLVNVGTTGAPKFVRSCPMWIGEDLIYGMWKNMEIRVRQPDDMDDLLQVGARLGMGCARVREETFVCIHCDEGYTPAAA